MAAFLLGTGLETSQKGPAGALPGTALFTMPKEGLAKAVT